MARIRSKRIEYIEIGIQPTIADHEAMIRENCSNPRGCRYVVAVHRGLKLLGMGTPTKVWVDAGHIRASLDGARWEGDTPKRIRADLINLDKWLHLPKAVRAVTPPPFDPRSHTVRLTKKAAIRKATPRQLAKLKANRARRKAAGLPPDRGGGKFTFHSRVVGYA